MLNLSKTDIDAAIEKHTSNTHTHYINTDINTDIKKYTNIHAYKVRNLHSHK